MSFSSYLGFTFLVPQGQALNRRIRRRELWLLKDPFFVFREYLRKLNVYRCPCLDKSLPTPDCLQLHLLLRLQQRTPKLDPYIHVQVLLLYEVCSKVRCLLQPQLTSCLMLSAWMTVSL